MLAIVLFSISQHTKSEVPSFTDSKDGVDRNEEITSLSPYVYAIATTLSACPFVSHFQGLTSRKQFKQIKAIWLIRPILRNRNTDLHHGLHHSSECCCTGWAKKSDTSRTM